MAEINMIVHYPKSTEDQDALARRVSEIHAAAVIQRIKSLHCPNNQQLELLDAVIGTAKESTLTDGQLSLEQA